MAINKRIRRRLILLCTLTLLLTIGLVAGFFYAKWNRERQVEFAAQQGMAAYEAGDYLSALPKLSKAVSDEKRKNDLELVLALGQSRLRNIDPNGRHIRASEKFFLHALSIDPNNTEALEELVNIYVATGDTANVLTYSDRLPDGDIKMIKKRAGSLRASGRLDEAIEEIRRIRDLAPSDTLWPLYEFTLFGQRGDDIEDRLERALEHARNHPDNQGIMAALISLYREQGRFDDARNMTRT